MVEILLFASFVGPDTSFKTFCAARRTDVFSPLSHVHTVPSFPNSGSSTGNTTTSRTNVHIQSILLYIHEKNMFN